MPHRKTSLRRSLTFSLLGVVFGLAVYIETRSIVPALLMVGISILMGLMVGLVHAPAQPYLTSRVEGQAHVMPTWLSYGRVLSPLAAIGALLAKAAGAPPPAVLSLLLLALVIFALVRLRSGTR